MYILTLCTYIILQVSSGSDLGMLMMTHLKEKMIPVTDEWLGKSAPYLQEHHTHTHTHTHTHVDCTQKR